MLGTQRTVRHLRRRAMPARRHRKVYVGGAVTCRASSQVFLSRTTQQAVFRMPLADWLGAAATLAGIAGWGMLLVLLGA